MTPIVLIGGTWLASDDWWKPGSKVTKLLEQGCGADVRPFKWTGRLAGVLDFTPDDPEDPWDDGNLREWAVEAQHLKLFCHDAWPDMPVSLLAHSHGGQLAALAIAYGLMVRHLVTVATPPRRDLAPIYARAKAERTGQWWHLYGDWWRDWMIKAGLVGDGALGWRRTIEEADRNIHVPGCGHSDLLRPLHLVDVGVVDLFAS